MTELFLHALVLPALLFDEPLRGLFCFLVGQFYGDRSRSIRLSRGGVGPLFCVLHLDVGRLQIGNFFGHFCDLGNSGGVIRKLFHLDLRLCIGARRGATFVARHLRKLGSLRHLGDQVFVLLFDLLGHHLGSAFGNHRNGALDGVAFIREWVSITRKRQADLRHARVTTLTSILTFQHYLVLLILFANFFVLPFLRNRVGRVVFEHQLLEFVKAMLGGLTLRVRRHSL